MMPKFRLQGTIYTFMDVIVEAKDKDEAVAIGLDNRQSGLDWDEVGTDWEFHKDLVTLESEGRGDA